MTSDLPHSTNGSSVESSAEMTARSLPPSRFMRVALGAAEQARGRTGPNPWVGAVVARGHEQVSVACTQKSGSLHAEAAALVGVDTAGATLYTTLEPCVSFPEIGRAHV